jgi:hypothetical protein
MQLLGNSQDSISILQDPFKKDCVSSIDFTYRKFVNRWDATVRFKNGNTGGHQEFTNPDFVSIVKEVEAFIKTL